MGHRSCLRAKLTQCSLAGVLLASWLGFAACSQVQAAEPLRQRIDQLLSVVPAGAAAVGADEAEVLRRLYLDLTGSTPPTAITRAYLADTDPQKYDKLIDRLLSSPEYVRHMAERWDVLFMERRPDKHIPAAEWQKFLYDSVAANKPYHLLAREILSADGADPALRPAAKFILDREVETHSLTRDVGRIFFGRDLQCAQCHDHPLIDSYYQADYFGIYAFLNRSFLFTDKEKKVYVGEKADGDVNFTSVFTKESGRSGPRVPGGEEVPELPLPLGEEYQVAPADNVRPVPKYSRRLQLAEWATRGDNLAFNRNIANRLWAQLMGRGLVEPLDLHHVDNPPVYPALLDLLATEFAAMQFDVKAFLKELVSSQTYRRAAWLPATTLPEQVSPAIAQLTAVEAELLRLQQVAEEARAAHRGPTDAVTAARTALGSARDEWGKIRASEVEAKKSADMAAQALAAAQQQLTAKQELHQLVADAAAKAGEAAKKLPDEKELAQAAEKFQTRAAELATGVATATEAVNALVAPAKEKADVVASIQQQAAAALAKLQAAQEQLIPLDQTFALSRRQLEQQQELAAAAAREVIFLKSMAELGTRTQAVQQATAQLQTLQSERGSLQQLVAKVAAELPAQQAQLTAAQQAHAEVSQGLPALRQSRDDTLAAATTYAEVLVKAEAAAGKLPQDMELQQVLQAVKARHAQLQTDQASKQQALAEREQQVKTAAEQLAAAQLAVTEMQAAQAAAQQKLPPLETQLAAVEAQEQSEQKMLLAAGNELTQRWSERFLIAPPKAKTPEQIFWSIMQATGVSDNYRSAGVAEADKAAPLDPNMPADPAKLAQRAHVIENHVYTQLKGNAATFVSLFSGGPGPGQGEFFATADQALYFANGGVLQSWIVPSGGNLAARLGQLEDPQAICEELYLTILVRRPSEDEVRAVTEFLAARPQEKKAVIEEMIWGLIASAEFRFVQ